MVAIVSRVVACYGIQCSYKGVGTWLLWYSGWLTWYSRWLLERLLGDCHVIPCFFSVTGMISQVVSRLLLAGC